MVIQIKLSHLHLLEAKDFLIRNNINVETHLIKNCDHHIPMKHQV